MQAAKGSIPSISKWLWEAPSEILEKPVPSAWISGFSNWWFATHQPGNLYPLPLKGWNQGKAVMQSMLLLLCRERGTNFNLTHLLQSCRSPHSLFRTFLWIVECKQKTQKSPIATNFWVAIMKLEMGRNLFFLHSTSHGEPYRTQCGTLCIDWTLAACQSSLKYHLFPQSNMILGNHTTAFHISPVRRVWKPVA